ncbi:MAG: hypothetical protein KIH06_00835 [Kiritimatiellae bacterium]|nr:hypothetical protein [Kiritimatiellia bacterium]
MNIKEIKRIGKIVSNRPENLFLVGVDNLLAYAADLDNLPEIRRSVLSELIAQWCVSGSEKIKEYLSEVFPTWRNFEDWYAIDQLWISRRALPEHHWEWWRDPDQLEGCESNVRQRLAYLFRVDGFIPVYDPEKPDSGWYIPFALEEVSKSDMDVPVIIWNDGQVVTEWQEEARAVLGGEFRCRLQMLPEEGFALSGASMMLPLKMAVWRKKSRFDFPQYDVLRVLATGKFDGDGRLASVGTAQKYEVLKKCFRNDAVLIGPDVPGEIDIKERNFIRLDIGVSQDQLKERLKKILERSKLAHIDWRYARRRLPDMSADVDRLNRVRWSEVADILGRIKERIQGYDDLTFLNYTVLYATALCHAGRTEEAVKINREAYEFAVKHGMDILSFRLQIEALVSAQDEGDLDFFLKVKDDIGIRIEERSGGEYDDLRMRYYGTLAQAEMWGVCLNLNGYDKQQAKTYAETALETAKRIASSVSDDSGDATIDEAESNVQQDMNYLHLWYALFEPGTDGERNQCRLAVEHIQPLSEDSRRNNMIFLQRQKSLALLNAWQNSGVVPDRRLLEAARVPLDAEGWLIAANRSHLGPLYAELGDFEEAKRLFQEGETVLSFDKCFSPVLASIRFMLLVRATCSLRMKDSATAEGYYQKAEEVKVKFGESKLFRLMNVEQWMSVVHSGADSRNLPQFYY